MRGTRLLSWAGFILFGLVNAQIMNMFAGKAHADILIRDFSGRGHLRVNTSSGCRVYDPYLNHKVSVKSVAIVRWPTILYAADYIREVGAWRKAPQFFAFEINLENQLFSVTLEDDYWLFFEGHLPTACSAFDVSKINRRNMEFQIHQSRIYGDIGCRRVARINNIDRITEFVAQNLARNVKVWSFRPDKSSVGIGSHSRSLTVSAVSETSSDDGHYTYTNIEEKTVTPIKLLGCSVLFLTGVIVMANGLAGRFGSRGMALNLFLMLLGAFVAFASVVFALPL